MKNFGKYLVTGAGIHRGRVAYLSGVAQSNKEILAATRTFVDNARTFKDSQEPGTEHFLVVAYHGHGLPEGYCPDGTPASYYDLVDTIGFDFSFLFINSCCYAGAAIDAFRNCGVLPSFGSVIASSRSYKPSYGAVFLEELVASWKERKEFRRNKIYVVINDERGSRPVEDSSLSNFRTYTQIPTRSGISLDHILYPMR